LSTAAQQRIREERAHMLAHAGLNPQGDWQAELAKLKAVDAAKLRWKMFAAWDRQLDLGVGECVLARPDLSAIVADSLLNFDGHRYVMTDFVIMPNHVHVLAALADADLLLAQCESWKRYTARLIHKSLGRSGEFWQVEQFDHLVRSLEQFEYFRQYLRDNPKNAGLPDGSYRWYSKTLGN
jgi:putative transposase